MEMQIDKLNILIISWKEKYNEKIDLELKIRHIVFSNSIHLSLANAEKSK